MSSKTCSFPGCDRAVHGKGLCNPHHLQQNRGKPLTPLKPAPGTIPLAERFWANVHRGEECWDWTGAIKPQGYGCMSVDNKLTYAHRISWEIATRQTVPVGLVIDHICANRKCVRPSHLRVTTQQNNAQYRPRGGTPLPKSGIRGVYQSGSRWQARVAHGGAVHNLGNYDTPEEAGLVVEAKRKELLTFPEFQGEAK